MAGGEYTGSAGPQVLPGAAGGLGAAGRGSPSTPVPRPQGAVGSGQGQAVSPAGVVFLPPQPQVRNPHPGAPCGGAGARPLWVWRNPTHLLTCPQLGGDGGARPGPAPLPPWAQRRRPGG